MDLGQKREHVDEVTVETVRVGHGHVIAGLASRQKSERDALMSLQDGVTQREETECRHGGREEVPA